MDDPEALETEAREHPDPTTVGAVRRRLLEHYDAHRRELPWRKDDDPYRIWVSEVMLQQTRVGTVIPYYRRWIERFPHLDDLAAADQEEVLQMWKGLGYYSRARNLHRAARIVRERHGGRVPDTTDELEELPGVGKYTAGAVASIAFQRPVPAVDGNVRRVLSRLHDLADPGDAELRRRAASLVDPDRPGCFNQALMELGATVCTPSDPECPSCPVEDLCLARSRGTVEERPRPRKRAPVTRRSVAVGIPVSAGGRTLLVRRPEDGLLGGLWEFPAAEAPAGAAAKDGDRMLVLARKAAAEQGAKLSEEPSVELGSLSHAFTHLRVTYHLHLFPGAGYAAREVGSDPAGEAGSAGGEKEQGSEPVSSAPRRSETRVVSLEELDELPLPVAQQKIGRRARQFLAGDAPVR